MAKSVSLRLSTHNHVNNIRIVAQDETNLFSPEQREAMFSAADYVERLEAQYAILNRISTLEQKHSDPREIDEIRTRLEILENTVSKILQVRAERKEIF